MRLCDLPDDCIYEILKHLPAVEAYKLTLVCKHLRRPLLYSQLPTSATELAQICIMMNFGWTAGVIAATTARVPENGISVGPYRIGFTPQRSIVAAFSLVKTPVDVWEYATRDYVDKRVNSGLMFMSIARNAVFDTKKMFLNPTDEVIKLLTFNSVLELNIPAKPETVAMWCVASPHHPIQPIEKYVASIPKQCRIRLPLNSMLWHAGVYSHRCNAGPPAEKSDIKRLIGDPNARLCDTHDAKLMFVALIPKFREAAKITPQHFTTLILEFGPPGLLDIYSEICQPVIASMNPRAVGYLIRGY
jgi:F-box domain